MARFQIPIAILYLQMGYCMGFSCDVYIFDILLCYVKSLQQI